MNSNIRQKNIAIQIILAIITCGISNIFWLSDMSNSLRSIKGERENGITDGLLFFFTCGLYGIFLAYKYGDALDSINQSRGQNPGNYSIIFVLVAFFGFAIIPFALTQHTLNKLCESY